MNRVESGFYNIVGINPESDKIKWYSVAFFEVFSKLDRLIHLTRYQGVKVASEGAAYLLSIHTSMWDTAKGYHVGKMSGRIPRTYTRESLLDPTKSDSERVKERTGNKTDILNSNMGWLKRIIAAIPVGLEAIPVPRGSTKRQDLEDFKTRGRERFAAGQLVASFVQDTRNKEGKLVNPVRGVALLARENPDVPMYFMAIAKSRLLPWLPLFKHHRVSISGPITYNQMRQDPNYSDFERANPIIIICDQIANQLEPAERDDWYSVQRPLITSRRRGAS